MPRVALITRTKNRPALLGRALDSALHQTFTDWVQIIVNDGGDEAPVQAALAARESAYRGRQRLLSHPQSCGMEAASNAGLRLADSDFVVIHDDDDSWEPRFLEKTVALLEARGPASHTQGVITRANKITETVRGDDVQRVSREDYDFNETLISLYVLAAGNTFAPIQFLYRRAVLDTLGGYREDLPVLGDWEFNLRFLLHHDIEVLAERLANYHFRTQDPTSVYSNSVVGGLDKHRFFNLALRNEWLRSDINTGRCGLGFLAAFGATLRTLDQRSDTGLSELAKAQLEQAARENQQLSAAAEKLKRSLATARIEKETAERELAALRAAPRHA